jgi:ribosomal protein S11
MLIVHIITYRSNYFVTISNVVGKVLFTQSVGNLGIKDIKKRSIDSLFLIILHVIKQVLIFKQDKLFFKLDGFRKGFVLHVFKKIVLYLKEYSLIIIGCKFINKIPHNGCRKKKALN